MPNWKIFEELESNEYGLKPIDKKVIDNCKYLYENLNIKTNNVFATNNNSIQLEFENKNNYFEINIYNNFFEIFYIKNQKEHNLTYYFNDWYMKKTNILLNLFFEDI